MPSKRDQHKRIKARIQGVVKLQEAKYNDRWKRYVDLYAGKHWQGGATDQERITVPIAFSIVNVIVPALTHNYPRITINPVSIPLEDMEAGEAVTPAPPPPPPTPGGPPADAGLLTPPAIPGAEAPPGAPSGAPEGVPPELAGLMGAAGGVPPAPPPEEPPSRAAMLAMHAENTATIVEAVLNQTWRQLEVQDEVAEAIKDGIIMGVGWVKVGWRRAQKKVKRSEGDRKEEAELLLREKAEYASKNPDQAKNLPDDKDTFDSIPTTQKAITHDDLFVERVSPKQMFVDPEATDLKDAKFVFQRVVKPLDAVKANPLYRNTDKLRSDTSSGAWSSAIRDQTDIPPDLKEDIKRVTLFEYWDISDKTWCVFADGVEEPLYGPEPWPCPQLPFEVFRNHPVPDRFFGLSDLEMVEDLQMELNKTRSQMLQQRKQFNRKGVYKENAFLGQHIEELRSDEDGTLVPVRANVPLSEAIQLLTPPQIDARLYQIDETVKSDITDITSVSEYQRGQLPDIRRTATEASIIESSSSIRAQHKLAQVERFMGRIGKKMLGLMQKYYTEERVVRVVGEDGAKVWFAYNADLLEGEFDVEVEAGSTQPRNDAVRRQEASELYQIFAGNPAVDQVELVKFVLRQYRVPNMEKLVAPQQAAPVPDAGALAAETAGAPPEGGMPPPEEPAGPAAVPEEQLLDQIAGQMGV